VFWSIFCFSYLFEGFLYFLNIFLCFWVVFSFDLAFFILNWEMVFYSFEVVVCLIEECFLLSLSLV